MKQEPFVLSDDLKVSGDTRWVTRQELETIIPAVSGLAPSSKHRLYDDFISIVTPITDNFVGDTPWGVVASAGSTMTGVASDGNHPGILRLSAASGIDRMTAIYKDNDSNGSAARHSYLFGSGETLIEALIRLGTSVASADYTIVVGFGDVINGVNQLDGSYFQLITGSNNTEWSAVTANNGVRTTTDTNVAGNTTNWQKLKIVINDNATQADFYINGTLAVSNTTNIPSTAGREFGIVVMIYLNSSNIRTMDIDYILVEKKVTR